MGSTVDKVMSMKQPFENAVREHGEVVLRVCRAVLGVHTAADDAWSETFLSALRAWPDLPDDANVRAWLVTIAHRKAVDVVRREARTTLVPDPPERLQHNVFPDEDSRELWQRVAALPERQRQAIAYHHLAGLPYAQVAELIGGSTDAVRRAAADGMKNLRAVYAQDEEIR